MTIPALNSSGTLPPFFGIDAAERAGSSPYKTTMLEIAERFCATPERMNLFRSWVSHRKALTALGFSGSQWIDGSFCEDIETIRGRPPGDIDMVYLVHPPKFNTVAEKIAFFTANQSLLYRPLVKAKFHCDIFTLDMGLPAHAVRAQLIYLFGLFSHQRTTHLWKGMLEVALAADDDAALAYLDALASPPVASTPVTIVTSGTSLIPSVPDP